MAYGACTSTGKLTSSQVIVRRSGMLTSCLVRTDGTNAATVTIYDNTEASGKILGEWMVQGATGYGGRNWPEGAFTPFDNGLYISISGTGAWAIVEYI